MNSRSCRPRSKSWRRRHPLSGARSRLSSWRYSASALLWSWLGRIDIVAIARGSIQPTGHVKIVQPAETGVVRAVYVKDGDRVKAGQPLIDLDPTIDEADIAHVRSDLTSTELTIARLRAALDAQGDPAEAFHPPPFAPAGLAEIERQHLVDQVAQQNQALIALDREEARELADRDATRATVQRLTADLPTLRKLRDIYQAVYMHGSGSQVQYLRAAQAYVDGVHQLSEQKSKLKAAEAAAGATIAKRKATVAEYRSKIGGQLLDSEAKAEGLRQDLIKAREHARLQVLRAPVDGVVQQLSVHTVGGVVAPAQALLVVVPVRRQLEAQVELANSDVGFVRPGQTGRIKLDAFPFTRYGLLHGKVASLSADSIDPAGRPTSGAEMHGSSDSGPKDQPNLPARERLYSAHISLDRTSMTIDGAEVAIRPGLAVTVEIKTGSRRVLSYLLSPLARYAHDSLGER